MDLLLSTVGWVGALAVLAAYALLTAGRTTPTSRAYQALNVVGGAGLLVHASLHSAWPSAVTNAVWLLVGGLALARVAHRPAA